jgi:PGF-CTERM protein
MTYEYEVKSAVTSDLYSGQYFVVIQHPMYNDQFDVYPDANAEYVLSTYPVAGSEIFKLTGPGSLQSTDAGSALATALDAPAIDDTYTKLQFLVEEPKITILPMGEQQVGSKFDISGTTNLAYDDDDLLVEVTSSSFAPTDKSQSGEFSGVSGTVPVVKGADGINKWSFPVDASTFKPDEYIVRVSGITNDVVQTGIFNVVEFSGQPTTAPTPVVTAVATPEVNATVAAEVAETVVENAKEDLAAAQEAAEPETPTPTQSPGFGALIALSGLVAVAFLVMRRS